MHLGKTTLPLEQIVPDPTQPRKQFDEVSLKKLADNIKIEGIIHPVEVREEQGKYILIVGERRYRAAKLAGLREIPVTLHSEKMTPYEQLRRQMAENLHQSAASKGGEAMNAMDTARGWAKLYKFKTGKQYKPGYFIMDSHMREIIAEVGATVPNVEGYLRLLNQPEILQDAVSNGTPRSYVTILTQFPKKFRKQVREKIVAGDYGSRKELEKDAYIIKKYPEQAKITLERKQAQQTEAANRLTSRSASLGLAMSQTALKDLNGEEAAWVRSELEWLVKELVKYLK